MNEQKVYLVWKGQYSDKQLIGLFTERTTAKALKARLDGTHHDALTNTCIEERTLNARATEISAGLPLWQVWMSTNGDCEKPERVNEDTKETSNWEQTNAIEEAGAEEPETYSQRPDSLFWTVYARDEEHAVKVAGERRTRWLVQKDWEAKEGK